LFFVFIINNITVDNCSDFLEWTQPWINWTGMQNPNWWRSYNNVKHQRNNHFHEANLKNTIHAVGALLLTVIYYYKFAFSKEAGHQIDFRETTSQLKPEASFLRINADYYYRHLMVK